jgi:hypothetical protein
MQNFCTKPKQKSDYVNKSITQDLLGHGKQPKLDPMEPLVGISEGIQPFFFFPAVLGLDLRVYILNHSTSGVKGLFEIGSHGTIFLDWLRTAILLISRIRIARITNVSQ